MPSYGLVFAGAAVLYTAFYLVPLWSRGRALRPTGLDALLIALRRDLDGPAPDTAALNPPRRPARERADERTRRFAALLNGELLDDEDDPEDSEEDNVDDVPAEPAPRVSQTERLAHLASLHTDYGDGVVQEAVDALRVQFPDGPFTRFEVERLPVVAAFAERVAAARTMAGLFVLVGLFFTMARLNGVVGAIADAAGGATMAPGQFLATMGALMNGIGGAFDSSIAGLGLLILALVAVGVLDFVASGRVHTVEKAVAHTVIPQLSDLRGRLVPAITLADLLAETSAHLRTLGQTVDGLTVSLDGSLAGLGDRIEGMMSDFGSFQDQYANLNSLLGSIGEASTHLRETTGALKGAARRIGDPLDDFNKTLLRHLETVADAVATTRDGFETLGEQVAVVAAQTDSAVGRVEATAADQFGTSAEAQRETLGRLATQSAAIEAHFKRLADALGRSSQVRIDESLARIDRAVDRLAETEDAPQTFFAFVRDSFRRRRPRAAPHRTPAARPESAERPAPERDAPVSTRPDDAP